MHLFNLRKVILRPDESHEAILFHERIDTRPLGAIKLKGKAKEVLLNALVPACNSSVPYPSLPAGI